MRELGFNTNEHIICPPGLHNNQNETHILRLFLYSVANALLYIEEMINKLFFSILLYLYYSNMDIFFYTNAWLGSFTFYNSYYFFKCLFMQGNFAQCPNLLSFLALLALASGFLLVGTSKDKTMTRCRSPSIPGI